MEPGSDFDVHTLNAGRATMSNDKIQGEGDYVSGRKFQDMQHEFAKSGPVTEKAREAEEALDGPEGEELEQARQDTADGKIS
jgi:hypothetical protein